MILGAFVALFFVFTPQRAHAYLDPGTGSYIFQILIASLLGAAFAIKVFWLRIKTFVVGLVSKRPKDE
jgi:hypothetical protein